MALLPDIAASYRRPLAVARAKVETDDDRLALFYLLLSCWLIFVGQWPVLSRRAFLTGQELEALMAGALMGWVFVAPVLLYLVAWIVAQGARLLRRPVGGFGSRMALFWALTAALPLWLLNGLAAALAGPGPALTLLGAVALGAFGLFWGAGLRAARAREAGMDAGAAGA